MTREPGGTRPLPALDADSRPFWESCHRRAMAVQQCASCRRFRFPPRGLCPYCHLGESRWVPVTGHGRVYASLVVSQPPATAWKDAVPFNLSLVELDEGVRMWTNVTGCAPDDVRIDDRVRIAYDAVTAEVTLPRFTRAADGDDRDAAS
jgi:uncharacterized OB-fold protein